ncbi:acyl-CoA N-acyltransferase [Xylariaceae sp. FL1651]|nr:acyl-CoA N-acyltransferase [Xylariaceae sp. FL1651]
MTDPNPLHSPIETRRLILRHLQPTLDADCDLIVRLYNTPEFIDSIGGTPTSIDTREAARKYIENRFLSEYRRNGYGTYLILLKPPSAATAAPQRPNVGVEEAEAAPEPVGTVSLTRGDGPDAYLAPDLGFAVLPAYMRQGIATEASRGLLDYFIGGGAGTARVTAVLGLLDLRNEASKGVFRGLGFDYRGRRVLQVFGSTMGEVWSWPAGLGEDELRALGLPEAEKENEAE